MYISRAFTTHPVAHAGVSGTADSFFRQFLTLCPRGYRLIAAQWPPIYGVAEWVKSFDRFLDVMRIDKVRPLHRHTHSYTCSVTTNRHACIHTHTHMQHATRTHTLTSHRRTSSAPVLAGTWRCASLSTDPAASPRSHSTTPSLTRTTTTSRPPASRCAHRCHECVSEMCLPQCVCC